jgi:hypothetical protein
MDTLLAFLWAPLALFTLSSGLALLADRVLRTELPAALLAPVGMAILVALVMPVYKLGGGSTAALVVILPCAAAGFLLTGRSLGSRLKWGWAGLAALAAFGLYMAPVVLSGHWTWPGYNFVNDTAPNLLFAELLSRQGLTLPAQLDSTTAIIEASSVNLGYPVGAHGLLATVQPITGVGMAAVYHPLVAAIAGMAALSMSQLARASGLKPAAAAVAGLLPVGAVLIYRYALHGGIKEILVVALIATGAALAREALDRELRLRLVVLLAICGAALLQVFSAVGAAYGLALGLLLLAVGLAEGRGVVAVGRLAAVGLAIALVAVAVNLSDVASFADKAGAAFASEGGASTAYLGHLARPIPLVQTAGVWITRDYRLPVPDGTETWNAACIVVVGLLSVVGIALEIRRRRPAVLLLLIPVAVVAAGLAPRLSPYATGKLLVVLSPAVVLLAATGALGLLAERAGWVRGLGGVGLAVIVGGVLVTDSFGYRDVTLAPPERIAAMTDVAEHADGGGVWLVDEWEEFSKVFMRDIKVNAAFEAESPRPAELRRPRPIFGRYYDLDELTLRYVESFPGIIKRRSPEGSRPPANYELEYVNDYYEAWRRTPKPRVIEHLGLQSPSRATARPDCGRVRALASRARKGDRLVAAARPRTALLDPLNAGLRPRLWVRNVSAPDTVVPVSPGEMRVQRRTEGGRFRVWIRGSFGRPTSAYVDGHEVGAAHEINTPGQWVEVGEVQLSPGEHEIVLLRPDSKLGPGDSWRGELGPVALEPVRRPTLVSVAPGRVDELCGRGWDWIELTRG